MWSKWCCNGNAVGLLKHRASTIFGLTRAHGGNFRPFNHLTSGLGTSVIEYYGGQGKAESLSGLFNMVTRGISSSRCVSKSAEAGGGFMNSSSGGSIDRNDLGGLDVISPAEVKRLLRLVNVEALKEKLGVEAKEVISYSELLEACRSTGIARNYDEAAAFARILDEACVLLLFRDKVYLHPEKVVDLVKSVIPSSLTGDNDPTREELKQLQEKKEEIDVLAHKQVRRMLWTGLLLSVAQVGLFFRLTFWEFSWDVMEPVAFFTTTTGLVIGYAYFMYTSRDPSYQDLMKSLFLARQRKLLKKHNFDIQKFKELQKRCRLRHDACTSIKNRVGLHLDLEDSLTRD